MRGLVIDLFAGGGGASTGIERAIGRPVDFAINHDDAALAVHSANHPKTLHYQENIWAVDPREVCAGRPIARLWLSPDCTHHSKAKGGAPRSTGRRSLANVVLKWAGLPRPLRPKVIHLENVEEFAEWGPLNEEGKPDKSRAGEDFRAWCAALVDLGYEIDYRLLVAADYGAPTSRKRLFLTARCDGKPIVWPAESHGPGTSRAHRAAAEIIDWSLPCPSIFGRKRPLKPATMRRIAAGLDRYVLRSARPFIVPVTHTKSEGAPAHGITEPLRTITTARGGEFALVTPYLSSQYGRSVGRGMSAPVPTVTAGGGGHHALVAPTLVQTGYGERKGQRPRCLDIQKPLGTAMASGQKHGLVMAFLAKHYGGVVGHGVERSIGAITTVDHHSLVTASFVSKFYSTGVGSHAEAPLPTVTATGQHLAEVRAFLVKYYGTAFGEDCNEPLDTVTTKDRFGLVTVAGEDYAIADIGMRMLQPRELFNAQDFPPDYIIDVLVNGRSITKTKQVELAGNSVCGGVAEALVTANMRQGSMAA